MTPFSSDATALDEDPQLQARQLAARQGLDGRALPSWEEEVWRYSPIDELELERYEPAVRAAGAVGDSTDGVDLAGDRAADIAASATIQTRNGQIVAHQSNDVAGVAITVGADAIAGIGGLLGTSDDVFVAMNDAYGFDPIAISVAPNTDVAEPIVVVHDADEAGRATFPRLAVDVGANSSVEVIEIFRSTDVAALIVPVFEATCADAARVGYMQLQELGPETWQIGRQYSAVGSQGTFTSGVASFGGRYARARIDCVLDGRGSTGNLGAVYFGDGEQTLDFRTFQHHVGADTTSNLLFKGVLDDKAKSIYTGLIKVGHEARGTNAFQTNRNVKLSEDAWAESVPNLEIETDDVKCSHASTVGPIDEDQRFYLESRGVPTVAAEKLIVAGFFDEVLDVMPGKMIDPMVKAHIAAKLEDTDV